MYKPASNMSTDSQTDSRNHTIVSTDAKCGLITDH